MSYLTNQTLLLCMLLLGMAVSVNYAPVQSLFPVGGEGSLYYGVSMATHKGKVLIGDTENGDKSGSVYLYTFTDDEKWRLGSILVAGDVNRDEREFGSSVAIHEDLVVVGAPRFGRDIATYATGAVYVFEAQSPGGLDYDGGNRIDLTSIDAANNMAGRQVEIGEDGKAIFFSLPGYLDPVSFQYGAVGILRRDPSNAFVLNETIVNPSEYSYGRFGKAFNVISRGRLAISEPNYVEIIDGEVERVGRVWIYARNGTYTVHSVLSLTNFSQESIDIPVGFGTSVAHYQDELYISAPKSVVNQVATGVVYKFSLEGDFYRLDKTILSTDPTNSDYFGSGIVATKNILLIAANQYSTKVGGVGRVTYYDRNTLTIVSQLTAPDPENGLLFGSSIAVVEPTSGQVGTNGSIIVGAPGASRQDRPRGAVYVMEERIDTPFPPYAIAILVIVGVAIICCCILLICCVCCTLLTLLLITLASGVGIVGVGTGGVAGGGAILVKGRGYSTFSEVVEMDDAGVYGVAELVASEIVCKEKIGEGAYGVVYKGEWRGVEVAVKAIPGNVIDLQILQEFRAEAEVMGRIGNHPNICQLVGMLEDGDTLMLVSRYYAAGSLEHIFVKRKMQFRRSEVIGMLKDAATGLAHLHAEGVIHRDIAARNLLATDTMRVVVADFGMSRLYSQDTGGKTKTTIGPIRWMAPEMISMMEYSEGSDVWMFAATIVEIWTKKKPFPKKKLLEIAEFVGSEGGHPKTPKGIDSTLALILEGSFLPNPADRISMQHIADLLDLRYEELGADDPIGDGLDII